MKRSDKQMESLKSQTKFKDPPKVPPVLTDTPEAPKVPDWAAQPAFLHTKEQDQKDRESLFQGARVTKNIILCNDGVYRWWYEKNLLKRPDLYFLIWKIFFIITTAIFAFTAVADAIDWGRSLWESIVETAPIYGWFVLGMTVLTALGYLIYVAAAGGKYDIIYEMDEKGVNQKQMPRRSGDPKVRAEAKKGLRSGRISSIPTTVMETHTDFSRVKKGKIYPISHVIKLKEGLSPDRIYTEKEDFDFVKDYITRYCGSLGDPKRRDIIKR